MTELLPVAVLLPPGREGAVLATTRCPPRLTTLTRVKHVTPTFYVRKMPRISEFYGISILMFFGDHSPPHFHARYGGHNARVALDGTILAGHLPRRATRLVKEWAQLHTDELEACWERAVNHEPPGTIEPLP